MSDDLDMTYLFDNPNKVAEPQRTAAELKQLDELGTIGAEALRKDGSYVHMVTPVQSGQPRKPSDSMVLVVEDDDATASLIVTVLEKSGYRTRRARNRKEIANGLGAQPRPTLILLDVIMPDANGFDVLNRVKQHAALRAIPVVMLTSLSEKKDITKGLMLGADGYLTKPLMPSKLLDAVKTVTSG
jgi:CheY-like chemotaxis protein